jgi:hypothetical protein
LIRKRHVRTRLIHRLNNRSADAAAAASHQTNFSLKLFHFGYPFVSVSVSISFVLRPEKKSAHSFWPRDLIFADAPEKYQ